MEVVLPGGEAARTALLDRRIDFARRQTTFYEVLGTLFGDRVERVELLPPAGLRLHLSADRPATRAEDDEPIGTLTIRSADGRTVTRLKVHRAGTSPRNSVRTSRASCGTHSRAGRRVRRGGDGRDLSLPHPAGQ